MQGRLLPPTGGRIQAFPLERWREEVRLAHEAGLSAIEWIYEASTHDANPLADDTGLDELRGALAEAGVAVSSICADAFIEEPLARGGTTVRAERRERLKWVLGRAGKLGVAHVLVPFVDDSALRTPEEEDAAVEELSRALAAAEDAGVEIHLETSLAPERFRAFLDRLPPELVYANYDVGNSASLGYDPREELAAYGERIGSVHVKDRVRGGGTVPLGEGDADLPTLFQTLRALGWDGLLTLQIARGEDGGEVDWVRGNRERVEALWAEAA